MIRRMNIDDIPKVQEIDCLSFNVPMPRRAEGIQGYIEESGISLVYEMDGKVLGYIFNHVWGNFGWFGPLGVHPDFKGKGVGRALVEESIRIFKEDFSINNIGMSTMPESAYNIGFYTKLGFRPTHLDLTLAKKLDSENICLHDNPYSVDLAEINDELKKKIISLSNSISPGFDLSPALLLHKGFAFGPVFTVTHENSLKGFAACSTKFIMEKDTKNLEIRLLALAGDADCLKAIDAVLMKCSEYAKSIGYQSITLHCDTLNYNVYTYLISKHNFIIDMSRIRMIMGDCDCSSKYNGILLCRWSG